MSIWEARPSKFSYFGLVSAILISGQQPAAAIPSPDLVVGSLVSLSQLVALASTILGGGAVYATARARRQGARLGARAFQLIAAGIFVLLCGSIGFNVYQSVDHAHERQSRLEETLIRPLRVPGALRGDPESRE